MKRKKEYIKKQYLNRGELRMLGKFRALTKEIEAVAPDLCGRSMRAARELLDRVETAVLERMLEATDEKKARS